MSASCKRHRLWDHPLVSASQDEAVQASGAMTERRGGLPHRIHGIGMNRRHWIVSLLALTVFVGLAFPGPASAHPATGAVVHHNGSRVMAKGASTAGTQLTLANAVVVNQRTNGTANSYSGYPVTVNTGCGNSDAFLCLTMAGLGSFTISTPAPLQAGQVYHNPILTVTAGGQTCGEFQNLSGGYTSDLELDQFVFNQGNIETFAAQFSCVNANVGIFATIAYHMTNSTPHQGYYLFDHFGDTINFGNDGYLNYLPGPSYFALNQPVVGMVTTPDAGGYWMAAADGGVFALGDAQFCGSTGGIHLNKPVVGMAATPDGKGYWLVASDGGIFTFGDAHFYGSTGGVSLARPVTGMLPSPDGHGYLLVADDGGIFTFGDATFQGSIGGQGVTGIVGLVR
jgi:hypothetical protein